MSSDYLDIVPHSSEAARGIDFCGVGEYYYIVRSDVGVYLRSKNFNTGDDLVIYQLHSACRWGDHYLAYKSDLFYIIKGASYRRTSNMNSDEGGVVYGLHKNCQGGSYYYSAFDKFYIMFPSRGLYRSVTNMESDADAVEWSINTNYMDGIYFWGTEDYVYCLKQPGDWGVSYHRSKSMQSDEGSGTLSVNANVVNFLPGGIAETNGKAFGYWQLLKSFNNDSHTEVHWERTIKKTVGFHKSEMSSIEQDWNIHLGASYNSGALTAAFCKYQFSLDAEYGGKKVNTTSQDWNETTEVSEKLSLNIKAGEAAYVWQYQMGYGSKTSLFCIDLSITDTSNAPVGPPPELTPTPTLSSKL